MSYTCADTDLVDSCGNYSDVPADWGSEVLDGDEILLLSVGIFFDLLVALVLIVIVCYKYGEETREWRRMRAARKLPPYEKVADYLQAAEAILIKSNEETVIPRLSVSEVEKAGGFEDDAPHRATQYDRRSKVSTSQGIDPTASSFPDSDLEEDDFDIQTKQPKQPQPKRIEKVHKRKKARPVSSQPRRFLPLSKAKPQERLLATPDGMLSRAAVQYSPPRRPRSWNRVGKK